MITALVGKSYRSISETDIRNKKCSCVRKDALGFLPAINHRIGFKGYSKHSDNIVVELSQHGSRDYSFRGEIVDIVVSDWRDCLFVSLRCFDVR